MTATAGTVIAGRYTVREALAAKPACERYRVLDHDTDALVELWLFRAELVADDIRRSRLMGAAVEMRSLGHPHLVRMLDCGPAGSSVYVTVQPSEPAHAPVKLASPADIEGLLAYAASVADALEALHGAGQVHGRLSPDDVVEVGGLIKLAGAGLYVDLEPGAAHRAWGPLTRYWAPEVLRHGPPTPASDVYSLAVMLAERVIGEALMPGELCDRLAIDAPELAEALGAAMAVAPFERTTSPQSLAAAVRLALAETTARHAAVPESGPDDGDSISGPVAQVPDTWRMPVMPLRAAGELARSSGVPLAGAGEQSVDSGPTVLDGRLPPGLRAALQAAAGIGVEHAVANVRPESPAAELAGNARSDGRVLAPLAGGEVSEPTAIDTPCHGASLAPPVAQPARVPILEQPGMRPRIRPVKPAPAPPGGSLPAALGRYAPPARRRARGRSRKVLPSVVVGMAAVASGLAIALILGGGSASRSTAPEAAAGDPAQGCPAGMILVRRKAGGPYCIDAHEAPGQGRVPVVGVTLHDAEAACRRRGARLCEPAEWESACRGELGASGPHGLVSGNVAEWVAGGAIRGGSAAAGSEDRCSDIRPHGGVEQGYPDVGFRCCAGSRAR